MTKATSILGRIVLVVGLCAAWVLVAHGQEAEWKELNEQAWKLFLERKYSEAIAQAQRALEVAEKTFGPEHPNVATSLNRLAEPYCGQGHCDKAESLYKRSLRIIEKARGAEHPDVASAVDILALLYMDQRKHGEAEPLYKKSLAIKEKAWGPDNLKVIGSVNNLAYLYMCQGRYGAAEPLYQRALRMREKHWGTEHSSMADSLNDLAAVYYRQAKYAEAEPLYMRALVIREKTPGPEHVAVAQSLANLAEVYRQRGKYDKAEPLYKRSLAIYEKALGPDHPHVATSLNNLALLFCHQGKYSEAEPLYKRSLGIYEKTLGPDHRDVAQSLSNLATVYADQGKFEAAESLLRRSLAIYEKTLGTDHPDAATSLSNLGALQRSQGRYGEAESLDKRSLAIREKALGPDHPDVAASLNSLALLFCDQGKYGAAEPLLQRSLTIYEKALGPDHRCVAISLYNRADLYKRQCKYVQAEPLLKRALAILEKALGPDHPDVTSSVCALALVCGQKTDRKTAMDLFVRSLPTSLKTLFQNDPTSHVAGVFLQAPELADFVIDEPMINGSKSSIKTALFALLGSKYEEARKNYQSIVQWAEKNRHANGLFAGYTGLGSAYEGLGDNANAAEYFRKAVDFTEQLRSSLKQEDREKFFDVKVHGFTHMFPYEGLSRVLLKMNRPEDALKSSEYGKARVFAEHVAKRSAELPLDLPEDVRKRDTELVHRISALKQQREQAYKDDNKARIENLEPQVAELEKELATHVATLREKFPLFAATRYPQPMDLAQTAVKADEWVLSYHVTDSALLIYLTKGKEMVKSVLKPVPRKEIDDLIRKFREPLEVTDPDGLAEKLRAFDFASGKKLADILLSDVLPALPKDAPVIVIPDDSLGVLPFEMLVLNYGASIKQGKQYPEVAGADFFGDRNPISYYQSITALTLARTLGKHTKPADRQLVMADPVFDKTDERVTVGARAGVAQEFKTAMEALPPALMSIKNENGLDFPRLPLTGELGRSLQKANPTYTDLNDGFQASKPNLLGKDLTGFRSMVFATHGYFGNDLAGIMEPVLVLSLLDKPEQPQPQDGFLKLTEVMGMKVNADMVALTACQTGMGRRLSGEGTMGMGRAFQYAGARTVLMSLWSVAQESSVKLVQAFFSHRKAGKSKLEALKLARDEVRKVGYDHPFFWAPFILVGEVTGDTDVRSER